MKYYIIAGEASGDLHGSNLMKGIYEHDPCANIRFRGGNLMDSVYINHKTDTGGLAGDYNEGAVIGFSQIIAGLKKFISSLKFCKKDILKFNPDVVILVDYPGFNMKIAEFAHKSGYKVFYYIAPKVWASREGRIGKIKKYIDKLFVIFPFEVDYFKSHGIEAIYKGNPLADYISFKDRETFFKSCDLPDADYIAILPGSRKDEVKTMMPVCMEFADKLRRIPKYEKFMFIVAGAPSRSMEDYIPHIGDRDYVKVIFNETTSVIRHAKAAVVNSGTASLETCMVGTPQVVGYAGSPLNYVLGKLIIKVKYVSPGNLILNKKAVKELLQDYLTSDNLLAEIRRIMEDGEYRAGILSDYDRIKESLGGKGVSDAVAKYMTECLK